MNLLDRLPEAAFIVAVLAWVVSVVALRREGLRHWAHVGAWATAVLALLAFLHLVMRFVTLDLAHEYVYLYTRSDLPLRYRIAGAWAGRDGSLLLWAALTALVTAALAWWHRRHAALDAKEERARAWTRMLMALIAVAFLAAAAWQTPFRPTPAFLLAGRPGGNGLNPTLLSPFILIHPPLMFLAYSLAAVPAAAVMAHLWTGTDRWSKVSILPSRVNWALYTFAMGLGGLWAYYTLGFGGYWAWDPVEVANLLPWLALTVFLHAQVHHLHHGRYRVVGPFLGLLPFALTLLSTISTRSGLWVSVHAFTDPTNAFDPDGAKRFLDLLQSDGGLAVHVAMLAALLAFGLAGWARRLAVDLDRFPRVARVTAGVLAAWGACAVLAPVSAVSAWFEAAHVLSRGHLGIGLLGLGALGLLLPALPALVAEEPAGQGRERRDAGARKTSWLQRLAGRVNLLSLGYVAVVVLGLSLVVLVLFHFAAIQGWNEAFYTARLPVLATPAALGIMVMVAHGAYGRMASLRLAGGVLLAALIAALLVPAERSGAYLLVLVGAVVLVALDRVRRAWLHPSLPRGRRLAASLLWAAALLDVLFWLNPPSQITLGPVLVRPTWPIQLVLGLPAFVALWMAEREMSGRPVRPAGAAYLLAGGLGAFYVAPVLALAGWVLRRRSEDVPDIRCSRGRVRQAAVQGMHLAIMVALLGYTASTYFAHEAQADLAPGEDMDLGPLRLVLVGTETVPEPGGTLAEQVRPIVSIEEGGTTQGTGAGILYWEPQTGSHYPLPATWRLWNQEAYWNVDGVCIGPTEGCEDTRNWVRAYEAGPRIAAGQEVGQVALDAKVLPGVGLVWAALFLFVHFMAHLIGASPARER